MAQAAPVRDIRQLQRRVVITLALAQILGGIGVAAGAAVGALLAVELAGEAFSGLSAASSVIGAALIAIPVTRLMSAVGRRPGLALAYAIGIAGACLIILGAWLHFFPVTFVGMFLMGGGTTATLQSRYSATDLAEPQHRGRDLSIVIWSTTVGSVLGPNLAEPMGNIAERIGLPHLSGSYLLTIVVFTAAMVLIRIRLVPDPLIVAAEIDDSTRTTPRQPAKPLPFRNALNGILAIPAARTGLVAMALGQAVMVALMSMTPVHLRHADASLEVVGVIISGHITGMYIASPVIGIAADRIGRRPIILLGVLILLASFGISGTATGHETTQLLIGLFLLGLGWSCTMIGGSTLLTESLPADVRPRMQGSADLVMGLAGASAGIVSGVVVAVSSYAMLSLISTAIILALFTVVVQERLKASTAD